MNFKEFFNLSEDRQYVLIHGPNGYNFFGPTEGDKIMKLRQSVQNANNPDGIWNIFIKNGQLHLPPKLESDREKILHSYYKRLGFDRFIPPLPPEDTEGDTIEPSVFSARKPGKVNPLGATVALTPS